MNITTGIINKELQVSGCKFQDKILKLTCSFLAICGIMLFFYSCVPKQEEQEDEVAVKTDVKVSSPVISQLTHQTSYQAVTRYMQSVEIRSQLTGIVTQVNCSVAGDVVKNKALFIIQSQEAAALKKSKINNQILTGYSDTVYAHISGQISVLNVQVGDFVQAGDVLASCIRSNSLRIIAYIPVEQIGNIRKSKNCTVNLPDGTSVKGQVSGQLTSAETQDQTQAIIIDPVKDISLPENINLTVEFSDKEYQDALFVLKSAVLGNEEQTSFWVMKLLNDSICIKVPVQKGSEKDSLIQLIDASLTTSDLVISEGGYGLPDSASVQVINKKQ